MEYYYKETFTDKHGKPDFIRHCKSEVKSLAPFKQNDGGVFTYEEIPEEEYINGSFIHLEVGALRL